MRFSNDPPVGSLVIWTKPICPMANPSPISTSPPFPASAKHISWPLRKEMHGSREAQTSCSSVPASLLHDAHVSMSLKFKSFLQWIAGRRTSQTAGCRRALHVASVQVGGANDPGRSLTELIRRQLTIFDQTAHGRRTNG